jgi:hypothetical protein
MLNMHVCYDQVESDFTVHKVFSYYSTDFGKDDVEIADWILKYSSN